MCLHLCYEAVETLAYEKRNELTKYSSDWSAANCVGWLHSIPWGFTQYSTFGTGCATINIKNLPEDERQIVKIEYTKY